MILEKLEIFGFKSFANKTTILFNQPISGIVGPNGCGKSNILDALKWVMGERSVRSIRGETMEDIIFSGTSSKKGFNFAQVKITFDNQHKVFNIDAPKVVLSRRFDRDGQSYFSINDQRTSLKYFYELLLDTGLGKSAYSFMEQGRMDMILSSRPEERRYLFEEAAGISRFKAHQEEAEKNLQQTRINLVRLQDRLHDLDKELRIKQENAKKTREYNELRTQYKEHDLTIKYLSILESVNKKSTLEASLEKKNHAKEKLLQKILLSEEKLTILSEEKEVDQNNLHSKDTDNKLHKEKIHQYQIKIQNLDFQKRSFEEETKSLIQKLEEIKKRIEKFNFDLNKQNQFQFDLKNKIENLIVEQKNVDKSMIKIKEEKQDLETKLETFRKQVIYSREELKLLRKELEKVIVNLLEVLQIQKNKWEKERIIENKKDSLHYIKSFMESLYSIVLSSEIDIKKLSALIQNTLQGKKNMILDKIHYISNVDSEIFDILLNKTGIHSQKEALDKKIIQTEQKIELLEKNITITEVQIREQQEWLHKQITHKEKLQSEIRSSTIQKDSSLEQKENIKTFILHEEKQKKFFKDKLQDKEKNIIQINKEIDDVKISISKLKKSVETEIEQIDKISKKILLSSEIYTKLVDKISGDREVIDRYLSHVQSIELDINTVQIHLDTMKQNIYNEHSFTYEELLQKFDKKKSSINIVKEKKLLNEIQIKIKSIGSINPLALEELETLKELYTHNKSQLQDILDAEKSVLKVIMDISAESLKLFLETFKQIQENFKYTFTHLFAGGEANLYLVDDEKPLESGIDIKVQPPGKKLRSIRLLSGGERALTAIALLFAVYLVRSSPICVLDEIDAPLDDYNLTRFLNFLDHFKEKTQFILITHNKKTMAKADYLYGVTMQDSGISKLVEMKLKNFSKVN